MMVEGFEPKFHGGMGSRKCSLPCRAATLEGGEPFERSVESGAKSCSSSSSICLVLNPS